MIVVMVMIVIMIITMCVLGVKHPTNEATGALTINRNRTGDTE